MCTIVIVSASPPCWYQFGVGGVSITSRFRTPVTPLAFKNNPFISDKCLLCTAGFPLIRVFTEKAEVITKIRIIKTLEGKIQIVKSKMKRDFTEDTDAT